MKKIAVMLVLLLFPVVVLAQGDETCFLKKDGVYAGSEQDMDQALNAIGNGDKQLLNQLVSSGAVGLAPQKTKVQKVAVYTRGKAVVLVEGSSEQVWTHVRYLDCPWQTSPPVR